MTRHTCRPNKLRTVNLIKRGHEVRRALKTGSLHCLPFIAQSLHTTIITKTYLYNFDPLKPHFYIVKLGFTGVYIIVLISAQKHRLWILVRTARQGSSNEYPQSMFWAEIWKISEVLSENFQSLVVKFSIYFNRHVFVMVVKWTWQTLGQVW